MPNITFRGGRKPPHPESTHPRLHAGALLTAASLPPVPASVDWHTAVTDWPMYLNDQLGDCTCAEVGHQIEAATRYGQGSTVEVADSDILAEYERVGGYKPNDPSTDQGAVIQDVLGDWRKTGVAGHKCMVFAQLNVKNHAEIKQAVALTGPVDIGLEVFQSAMDQTNGGEPWEVVKDPGEDLGGHSVAVVGYDASYLYVITWGMVQRMTWGFWDAYVEEAWAVVTPEWFAANGDDPEGVDLQQLGEQFAALTGEPNPFPNPTPAPTPTPAPPGPAPDPDLLAELAALVRKVAGEAETDIEDALAFLKANNL